MTEIDLIPPSDVVPAVERCAAEMGLQIRRGTLANYPGCVHWHFTKPGSKGTLEATWWPRNKKLWLSIHSNREAPWQPDAIAKFKSTFSG